MAIALGLLGGMALLLGLLSRRKSDDSQINLPSYLQTRTRNSYIIAAGVAALSIGGATIQLNSNVADQRVTLNASQMAAARNTLQNSIADRTSLPVDLTNQYFFKAPTKAADGSTIYAKAAFFIANPDGTYTMRTISLDENGRYIGDPTAQMPFFIQNTNGEVTMNPQAQLASASQTAILQSLTTPNMSPTSQVASVRAASAQGHNVNNVQ